MSIGRVKYGIVRNAQRTVSMQRNEQNGVPWIQGKQRGKAGKKVTVPKVPARLCC